MSFWLRANNRVLARMQIFEKWYTIHLHRRRWLGREDQTTPGGSLRGEHFHEASSSQTETTLGSTLPAPLHAWSRTARAATALCALAFAVYSPSVRAYPRPGPVPTADQLYEGTDIFYVIATYRMRLAASRMSPEASQRSCSFYEFDLETANVFPLARACSFRMELRQLVKELLPYVHENSGIPLHTRVPSPTLTHACSPASAHRAANPSASSK